MHNIVAPTMPEAAFTVPIDDELKAAFAEAAKADDRTEAQIIREFMQTYVQRTREEAAYDAWFRHKVEAARAQARAGLGRDNDDVERSSVARRARLGRTVDDPDSRQPD